jgi:hypothetical protein
MEKLNIAEILRNCPKGMELDCTCADNVVFDKIIDYDQIKCVIGECRDPLILDKYGRLLHICCPKCVIFPKGKTTWEGFQRPFKDGDVLIKDNNTLCIYKSIHKTYKNKSFIDFYCGYRPSDNQLVIKKFGDTHFGFISEAKLATEEEKQKLFDAIKANGYKWNAETKTLEKLIEPKFKVGDRIKSKNIHTNYLNDNHIFTITEISSGRYWSNRLAIEYIEKQDDWELVPNKFDITTLKPFDKVLTRVTTGAVWGNDFFGYYKDGWFHCSGHIAVHYCIPYENNEHLLGTTNDCDDYYKTW